MEMALALLAGSTALRIESAQSSVASPKCGISPLTPTHAAGSVVDGCLVDKRPPDALFAPDEERETSPSLMLAPLHGLQSELDPKILLWAAVRVNVRSTLHARQLAGRTQLMAASDGSESQGPEYSLAFYGTTFISR